MMTCAEARKLLYDTETTAHDTNERSEAGSAVALAKAHIMVCMACNEYFERERAYVSTIIDRVSTLVSPIPTSVLASVLDVTAKARVEEYERSQLKQPKKMLAFFQKFFSKSR